jgi:hypothetical protein
LNRKRGEYGSRDELKFVVGPPDEHLDLAVSATLRALNGDDLFSKFELPENLVVKFRKGKGLGDNSNLEKENLQEKVEDRKILKSAPFSRTI